MMKKYNTPTIEALALETVDVICSSGGSAALKALGVEEGAAVTKSASTEGIEVSAFGANTWNW